MSATEDKRIIEPIGSSNKIAFELKVFIGLAIPIYFSQLATHATGVIAAMMTGNYSTVDQAAVATGNTVSYTHLTLPTKAHV